MSLPQGTALGAGPGPPEAGTGSHTCGRWARGQGPENGPGQGKGFPSQPGSPAARPGPTRRRAAACPAGHKVLTGPGPPRCPRPPRRVSRTGPGRRVPHPRSSWRRRPHCPHQDGGRGFAASHVVIGALKRAAPCPWRAGNGPGRLALRCWWSRRFLIPDAAPSGEGCAASLKHPQKRAAMGLSAILLCPQPTCPPPPPLEGAVLSRETALPLLGAEGARGRLLARTA